MGSANDTQLGVAEEDLNLQSSSPGKGASQEEFAALSPDVSWTY
jgi:hypothetical protein